MTTLATPPHISLLPLYEHPSLGRLRQPNTHHGGEYLPTNFLCGQVPHTHRHSLYMDGLQDHLPPRRKSYSP